MWRTNNPTSFCCQRPPEIFNVMGTKLGILSIIKQAIEYLKKKKILIHLYHDT